MATICAFAKGSETTLREFEEAPPLRSDVPLLVLIAESREDLMPAALASFHDRTIDAALNESQMRFAKRSTSGESRVVPKSTHLIAGSQPQAVASAVLEMLASIRRRGRGAISASGR
jgi:hypothetical protein